MSPLIESDILSRIASELSAEGYEVYIHPDRVALPTFLGSYRPDLVARRQDRNVAVEVASRSDSATTRLRGLAELFSGHEDWELRIVTLDQANTERPLSPQPPGVIKSRLEDLKRLHDQGQNSAAVIYGWAVFEAIGRALLPKHFAKAQTPARLVSVLASGGDITPTEADKLREIGQLRNLLVHGSLAEAVSSQQTTEFIEILERLFEELSPVMA